MNIEVRVEFIFTRFHAEILVRVFYHIVYMTMRTLKSNLTSNPIADVCTFSITTLPKFDGDI